MAAERHALPPRARAPRLALAGLGLLAIGLLTALLIARDLVSANARDLPANTWMWNLGQAHSFVLDAANAVSWLADGSRNIVIVPVVALVLIAFRQWRWAVFLVVVSQVGVVLSNALKFTVARERPPFIENTDFQQHLSFPSGHAFAGFTVWIAMAIIAWYVLPRRASVPIAVALVVVGVLQGPARLIVGKHWLTDVLGSILIGSGWLLLVWAGFLWWLAPRRREAAPQGASGEESLGEESLGEES